MTRQPHGANLSDWPIVSDPWNRPPEKEGRSLLAIGNLKNSGLTLSISRAIARYD
jgi:hypothetical protein